MTMASQLHIDDFSGRYCLTFRVTGVVNIPAMETIAESNHQEGWVETSDGVRLHTQWWKPSGAAKAIVCLVHGGCEHSGRYAYLANALTHSGYLVAAIDLPGHGRSPGRRVFIRSFDEYLADVHCLLSQAVKQAPGRPVFLLGHSLGGLIATLFVIAERPAIAGLVLSGPFLEIGEGISKPAIMLARIMGWLLPMLTITKALDTTAVSRNPDVVNAYAKDPLVHHGGIPLGTGVEVMKAIATKNARMAEIRVPLLVFHGTADRLAAVDGSKQLYSRASSSDKTLRLCEGLFHEVFNEPERDTLLDELVKWLDGHMVIPGPAR
jgi:alpha-beta hydrolase superfamily lysophospholipase